MEAIGQLAERSGLRGLEKENGRFAQKKIYAHVVQQEGAYPKKREPERTGGGIKGQVLLLVEQLGVRGWQRRG